LDALAEIPKFRGVRLRCEGQPDAEILTRPGVIEGIRRVAERGLTLDFLVVTGHLKDIPGVYEKVPGLKGIIDHVGKPDLRRGSDLAAWRDHMRAAAANTDAVCKLSIGPRAADMEEIYASQGEGWELGQLRPPLQFLLEQFGPERLAWGSDWPLVLLQSDYGGGLQAVRAALGPLDADTEMRLFRGTAMQFYSL
jgi:L-fuconolactonase